MFKREKTKIMTTAGQRNYRKGSSYRRGNVSATHTAYSSRNHSTVDTGADYEYGDSNERRKDNSNTQPHEIPSNRDRIDSVMGFSRADNVQSGWLLNMQGVRVYYYTIICNNIINRPNCKT